MNQLAFGAEDEKGDVGEWCWFVTLSTKQSTAFAVAIGQNNQFSINLA